MADWFRWRWFNTGYADFGNIQVPPVPAKIILTDRTTLVQWQLTYDTGTNALTLTVPNLRAETATIYDKNGGPRFPENTNYILTLNNGIYAAMFLQPPIMITAHNTAPIYARNGNASRQVLLSEFGFS